MMFSVYEATLAHKLHQLFEPLKPEWHYEHSSDGIHASGVGFLHLKWWGGKESYTIYTGKGICIFVHSPPISHDIVDYLDKRFPDTTKKHTPKTIHWKGPSLEEYLTIDVEEP